MTQKTRKQQIEEMLVDTPEDTFLRYALAMEYASMGDHEQALRCFMAMLTLPEKYVPAYLQAGQLLVRLNRIEEARHMFREGIEIAKQQGDEHAAGEMQGFLMNLG